MSTEPNFDDLLNAELSKNGMSPEKAAMEAKRQYIALKEQQLKLMEGLPFLHGWKWYDWAWDFFESRNKLNFLCAANQISKSSTQIRKAIHWATAIQLWPELWVNKPNQFWYLYPTATQATTEFETKWQQFLPKGEFKEHPQYGWRAVYKNKEIFAIYFNSGVTIYFKSYAQDSSALQTGTCDALFCDEELPVDLYEELIFRLSASDGYFHMVFTATLGQDFWRRVLEPGPKEEEALPGSFKRVVSMYECKTYMDGTASHWTDEKIEIVKKRCRNHNEVLKRVYGKFVIDGGRKYEAFDIKRHMKAPHLLPKDWIIYGGTDYGSGGREGHPSAIIFVAVRPDYRAGRVFLGWRGDGIQTTAGDVVEKYIAMKKEHKLTPAGQYYDWACRDFYEIAARMGEPFIPAEKSHDKGEQVLNVLFKNDMLFIYQTDELEKLAAELSSLRSETPKTKAKDDFIDALRYAVTRIPWDWSVIAESEAQKKAHTPAPEQKNHMALQIEERRKTHEESHAEEAIRIEDEFSEWNEHYGY